MKILVLFILVLLKINADGWEERIIHNKYGVQMYVYKIDNKEVAAHLAVPNYAQPTPVSCGATNAAMLLKWISTIEATYETNISKDSIVSIYNRMNTDGAGGLTTEELKNGLKKQGEEYRFLLF